MKKNKTALFVLPILVLLLISVVSAQTLIAGKIYNSDFSDTITGVEVTVQCGANSPKTTESISQGVYAINFPVDYCDLSDDVKVTLGNGYSGEETSTLKPTSEGDITKFAVINVNGVVVTTNSGNNGNSGSSNSGSSTCTYNKDYDWQCSEWSECADGIQARSCNTYNNCHNTLGRPALTQLCDADLNESQSSLLSEETTPGILSRITGAVVGVGPTGWIIILIFLAGLTGMTISVRYIRKKKGIR